MYTTLREFVGALDQAGELARVRAEVSPVLEISAIADRESRRPAANPPSESARRVDPRFHHLGGRALLFEHVSGSEIPVLINAFGSYRRMEMALGCDGGTAIPPLRGSAGHNARGAGPPYGLHIIADRIAALVQPQPPRSLGEAVEKARQFAPLLKIGPKRRRRGLCQEVVRLGDEVDLTRLPLLRCWPDDGDYAALGYPPGINDAIPGIGAGEEWEAEYRGRYVTFAGIHTIHADDAGVDKPASHNIGMYRVQLLGKRLMAMHWQLHHDGARHWRSWKKRGEPMPVAIAFGGESVLPYAATCPLPPGISELLMAGFLNGRGIEMVRAKTVPLWVPANAEIVIEGWVSTDGGSPGWDSRRGEALAPGAAFEGPFGDHTGFYSLPDRYGQLRVTALTHRREPILPATIVGMPPQEDYYIGKATERIMLPLLRTILPDIEDYDLPMFGAFHNAASVRIEKEYPLHARRVMHGVWGAGQMSWTKSVFVVDGSVDVHDHLAVLRAMAERCDPVRDIERVRGPIDVLDHATPCCGAGTKLGFDCTPRWTAEAVGEARPAADPRPFWQVRDDTEYYTTWRVLPEFQRIRDVLGVSFPPDLPGWLFLRADKALGEDKPGLVRSIRKSVGRVVACRDWQHRKPPRYMVVVGREVDVEDTEAVLFHWLANCDFGRDTHVWENTERSLCLFDATPKTPVDAANGEPVRDWPPALTMCEEMVARVEARWGEYGLA